MGSEIKGQKKGWIRDHNPPGSGSAVFFIGSRIRRSGSTKFCGIRDQNSHHVWNQGSKIWVKLRDQRWKNIPRYDPVDRSQPYPRQRILPRQCQLGTRSDHRWRFIRNHVLAGNLCFKAGSVILLSNKTNQQGIFVIRTSQCWILWFKSTKRMRTSR